MSNIPDQNLMNITAIALKDKNPEFGFLRGELRRHIKAIELAIKDAVKIKTTQIIYQIEQNFAVTKLTNMSAQRFIYSSIIDQLQINGFEVKLSMNRRECYFNITWITEVDHNETARQQKLIDNVLIS